MPFKSEKQRRYLWANEPEIARDWTDTYGSRIQKSNGGITDVAMQGGGPNYLGEQPMVNAPKYWQSSPDHEPAELAYITDKEKDILIDLDIYGSLQGSPNRGPSGIMSLQGDLGGWSSGSGGSSPGEGGPRGNDYKSRDYYNTMTGTGTTATSSGGDTVRSKNIAKGAVPEYVTVNPFTSDQRTKYVGSKYKSTGQPGFFSGLFSRTPGYRGTYGTGTGFFDRKNTITYDPINQRYQSFDPRVGNVKPGMGGRILGGLASMATGIPFVGGAIGHAIDYGKGIFGPKTIDMSQYNNLGLYDDRMKQKAFYDDALYSDNYSDMKISDTSFAPTTSIDEISMDTVDDVGNIYRDSPYATAMTEEQFNAVFGEQGEPG